MVKIHGSLIHSQTIDGQHSKKIKKTHRMSIVFCEYKGFSRAAQRTIFLNTYEIISQILFVWV